MTAEQRQEAQIEQSLEKETRKLCLKALGRNPEINEEILSPGQDPQDLTYLLSKIEEKFDLEITNEEAKKLSTLKQILNFVVRKTMAID